MAKKAPRPQQRKQQVRTQRHSKQPLDDDTPKSVPARAKPKHKHSWRSWLDE